MREWKASRVRLTMPTDFPQLKVKADLRVRKSYCASWAFSKTWCSLSVCFREVLRWLLHFGRYKIWYTTTRGVPIWGEQRFEPFQPKTSRSKLFSWAYMQFLLSVSFFLFSNVAKQSCMPNISTFRKLKIPVSNMLEEGMLSTRSVYFYKAIT